MSKKVKQTELEKMKKKTIPDFIIWNRLKALRQSRGLTQTQVAAGAGVSIATIWYLESGFDQKVTAKTKQKLTKYYGVKTSDIFPVEVRGEDIIK
jgi:transcriptional regulator with XRE-family HTH domain